MTSTMLIKQKEDQCRGRTDPTCYNCLSNVFSNVCSCWQTPPADIMQKILGYFSTFSDLIRMRIVCKSWNSIIMRRDIRAAPPLLFPWCYIPPAPDCSRKYLCFGSGRNLKLPKRVRGGWIYGSSKGWFIIVKERGLNSKMFLLNPISRVLHHLPSLRTIPFFKNVVKSRKWELFGAKEFCCHVALATHVDMNFSESFTVAAIFNDRKTLGLCRPGDKAWTVTRVLDINENSFLFDILFSSGSLYALVRSENEDGIVDAATCTINIGFGDRLEELKLKLVHDKRENKNKRIIHYRDHAIVTNGTYNSMLVESTNSEVLLIHQMLDFSLKTHYIYEDDEGQEGNDDIGGIGGNIEEDNEDIDQDDSGDEANNEDHDYDNADENFGNDSVDEGNGNEEVNTSDENASGDEANNEDHDYDEGDENSENDDVDQESIIRGDDEHEGESNGNEEDNTIDENVPRFNPHLRTRNFIVYMIDAEKENLIQLQSLGDQILFCGNDGSFSLPSSPFDESSTIYFARNSVWDYEASSETYTSREIGFFNFDEGRGYRFRTNRDMSVRYQGSWFTPRL